MRLTALVVVVAAGCGYSSQYVPRADGRPRAVWVDDHVEVEPAGAPLPPACAQWLGWASHADRLRLVAGELRVPTTSAAPVLDVVVATSPDWVPRFYGPPIVLPAPGVAPLAAPLFLPPPLLHAPGIPISGGEAVGPSIGSGGGGGGGGRGAAEILAAIAIVVAPAVAVGLAASPPEDTPENAEAIDQVNAYNDLLRSPGSPCAP